MKRYQRYLGGDSVGVTPVPIPNTEVKPDYVDGTARETVWESRKPPGLNKKPLPVMVEAFLWYDNDTRRISW